MIDLISLSCGGFLAGWILGRLLGPRRRGSNPPPPNGRPIRLDPGRIQRGNSSGGPTTPRSGVISKPQTPPVRVIDADGCTIGYRPLPQNGPDRDTIAAVRAADAAISDQALQAEFRAWWGARYPSPPGLGFAMIAVAWGRHLLTRGAAPAERFSPPGGQ